MIKSAPTEEPMQTIKKKEEEYNKSASANNKTKRRAIHIFPSFWITLQPTRTPGFIFHYRPTLLSSLTKKKKEKKHLEVAYKKNKQRMREITRD